MALCRGTAPAPDAVTPFGCANAPPARAKSIAIAANLGRRLIIPPVPTTRLSSEIVLVQYQRDIVTSTSSQGAVEEDRSQLPRGAVSRHHLTDLGFGKFVPQAVRAK